MNLVRTSFFCIILRSSLTEQHILKHEKKVPDLGENSEISTLFHKDLACHYHGDNGYAKACNESQIEMMKDPLENSAQEKKK